MHTVTTGTTAVSEKAPNYTEAQVARIRASAPLNFAKAESLGAEFGKSARSIIAKANREGIAYEAKPPATKKPQGVTKAKVVTNLASVMNVPESKLEGLDKAPLPVLSFMLETIVKLSKESVTNGDPEPFDDMEDYDSEESDDVEESDVEQV